MMVNISVGRGKRQRLGNVGRHFVDIGEAQHLVAQIGEGHEADEAEEQAPEGFAPALVARHPQSRERAERQKYRKRGDAGPDQLDHREIAGRDHLLAVQEHRDDAER
jgi:hypothetical protein